MTIQANTVYAAADGTQFATRVEAQAYQDTADRVARLTTQGFSPEFAAEVAAQSAAIVAALTLPSRMGRKPKAAAEAPAA